MVFYQIWRTLLQVEQLLLEGVFNPSPHDPLLEQLEASQVSRDKCIPIFTEKLKAVEELQKQNPKSLPAAADIKIIDEFLLSLRKDTLNRRSPAPMPSPN